MSRKPGRGTNRRRLPPVQSHTEALTGRAEWERARGSAIGTSWRMSPQERPRLLRADIVVVITAETGGQMVFARGACAVAS